MAAVTREQLHRMIDDLAEVRFDAAQRALDRLLAGEDDEAVSTRVAKRLRDEGLISADPPPLTGERRRMLRDRPFMKVRGEPVAETVVKNREPVA